MACPNPKCKYAGIGDSTVHAIVGDGHRGGTDDIPYWCCQCCQRRFSSRLGTPLYRLKTPPQRVTEAMTAFAEGVDVSAAHPRSVFGHDERTLSDWLRKGGQHAQRIQDRLLRDLHCGHLQLDELVTRVRSSVHRVWVWVTVDASTKLIAMVHISRRKRDDAMRFVHRLKGRLAPSCVPIITTDGLSAYFTALTAHFGRYGDEPGKRKPVWQIDPRLLYGRLHKIRQGRKLKHAITVVVCGTRDALRQGLQAPGFSGRVNTAYVERLNLFLRETVAPLSRRTLRQAQGRLWSLAQTLARLTHYLDWAMGCYNLVRPHEALRAQGWSSLIQTAFVERTNLTLRQSVHDLVRRTWGAAQSAGELMLRLEAWRGYYHFVRPHTALRQHGLVGGQLRWQQRTPAMAAGLTSHCWTIVEFLSRPVIAYAPTSTGERCVW